MHVHVCTNDWLSVMDRVEKCMSHHTYTCMFVGVCEQVWDAETGQCLHVLQGHSSTVRCVAMQDKTGECYHLMSHTGIAWFF